MTAHRLTRFVLALFVLAAVACSGNAPRATGPGGDAPEDVGGGPVSDPGTGDGGDGDGGSGGSGEDGSGEDGGSGDDGSGDDGYATRVRIEVKPGTVGPAPIRLGGEGKIPVAILGAEGFDASSIDLQSVLLAGVRPAWRTQGGFMAVLEDVDGDGRDDLVCHFEVAALALGPEAASVALEGNAGGEPFRGEDEIRIVP